ALGRVEKSERQRQRVVDTIPTMVWGARPDGQIDLCNRPLLQYVGATVEELGRGYSHLLYPDDVTPVMEKWSVALATGKPFESEHRVRGADGVYRCMLVRAAPLRDEHRKIVRWYGATTDIEERKKAEDKVRQDERELRDLVDSVPQHIVILDPAGRRLYANRASLDYYGCTLEEFRTPDFLRTVCHPDDIDELQRDREQLV